ncbi:unnamed protein product, partial [Prorocentrum cordatum]
MSSSSSSSLRIPLNAVEAATRVHPQPTHVDDQADDAAGRTLTTRPTLTQNKFDLWAQGNSVKLSGGSTMHRRLVLVVVAMATAASMVSFCVSFTVSYVNGLLEAARASGIASPLTVQIVLSTLLLWGARLMVACAPAAKGSGLPEIKCMLSGWRAEHIEVKPEVPWMPASTFVSCSTFGET